MQELEYNANQLAERVWDQVADMVSRLTGSFENSISLRIPFPKGTTEERGTGAMELLARRAETHSGKPPLISATFEFPVTETETDFPEAVYGRLTLENTVKTKVVRL